MIPPPLSHALVMLPFLKYLKPRVKENAHRPYLETHLTPQEGDYDARSVRSTPLARLE
jgi:hypothetical protein